MTTMTNQLATGPATSPLIRDFPVNERPRERLRNYGAGQLSNSELRAILFRTGMQGENVQAMASRILARFEGLATLSRTSFAREKGCQRRRPARF